MRSIIICIILFVILAGCSKNGEYIEVTQHQKEMKELQAVADNILANQKSENEKEMVVKNQRIKYLESQMSEIEQQVKKLSANEHIFDEDFVEVSYEDMTIRQSTAGSKNLEDGIICVLQAFDKDKELVWIQSWGGLQVSELPTFSKVSIVEDRIYIVVCKELSALDVNTGEIIWSVADTGSDYEAPIVSDEGVIYVAGQYAPYLTAVDKEGTVLWKIEAEELLGANSLTLHDAYLSVKCNNGVVKVGKDGTILK